MAPKAAVGIDFGLKDTAVTSDGERLEAGNFFRNIEEQISQAQRRGQKRKLKRLHRTAARRRKDALHKFSKKVVDSYQTILIGDVSSLKLAKTSMAKSVLPMSVAEPSQAYRRCEAGITAMTAAA